MPARRNTTFAILKPSQQTNTGQSKTDSILNWSHLKQVTLDDYPRVKQKGALPSSPVLSHDTGLRCKAVPGESTSRCREPLQSGPFPRCPKRSLAPASWLPESLQCFRKPISSHLRLQELVSKDCTSGKTCQAPGCFSLPSSPVTCVIRVRKPNSHSIDCWRKELP